MKLKVILSCVFLVVTGTAIGALTATSFAGKSGAIFGICNMAQTAVEEDVLSVEEVLNLAKTLGSDLQSKYSNAIVGKLKLDKQTAMKLSTSASLCSNIVGSLSQGIEAAQ